MKKTVQPYLLFIHGNHKSTLEIEDTDKNAVVIIRGIIGEDKIGLKSPTG